MEIKLKKYILYNHQIVCLPPQIEGDQLHAEVILLPLLSISIQHVNLDTSGIGSGQLRLVDIISHKIYCVNSSETLIDALAGTSTKSYRLEEIPLDQVNIYSHLCIFAIRKINTVKYVYTKHCNIYIYVLG